MTTNPFYVGGLVPPEYFVLRQPEIQLAFDLIANCSHCSFYGGSGMGKSSLLNILTYPEIWQEQEPDYEQFYIVYLSCTDINPFTPVGFWKEILNLLKEEVEEKNDLQASNLQAVIEQQLEQDIIDRGDLRKILREIGREPKYLLLLIDDYDAALRTHESYTEAEMLTFLSEFRNLAVDRRVGKYLCTMVTTFRRLNELGPTLPPGGSPWYNHYLFHLIKPYPLELVQKIFFSHNSSYCICLNRTLQNGILDIAHGHPALLQNAGHLLHGKLREGRIPDLETFAKDFQSRTEHIFDRIWQFSTEEEQILMMLIALSRLEGRLGNKDYALADIELIFSQKARELLDLEERGIIKQAEAEGKIVYLFTSSMMEWWVFREIENSKDEQLEKRERVLLKLMSREQATNVSNVIKLGWKNREEIISVATIFSKLFGNPT